MDSIDLDYDFSFDYWSITLKNITINETSDESADIEIDFNHDNIFEREFYSEELAKDAKRALVELSNKYECLKFARDRQIELKDFSDQEDGCFKFIAKVLP